MRLLCFIFGAGIGLGRADMRRNAGAVHAQLVLSNVRTLVPDCIIRINACRSTVASAFVLAVRESSFQSPHSGRALVLERVSPSTGLLVPSPWTPLPSDPSGSLVQCRWLRVHRAESWSF